MSVSLTGITVSRALPDATLAGLALGHYALHGGVIRHAAGTARAGQIVAHLLPSGAGATQTLVRGAGIIAGAAGALTPLGIVGVVASGFGAALSGVAAGFSIANWLTSRQILAVVRENAAVAELSLNIAQAGFAALDLRLRAVERTLQEVKAAVTAIRALIEDGQRAELLAALEHLGRLPLISDERVRIELLTHSATTLSKLRHLYRDRLDAAANVSEALSIEEYFLVAALAQARCYAELREPAVALQIITDADAEWRRWARPFARTQLLEPSPQRFLYSDLAASAPVPLLAAWLDFAHSEQLGLMWVEGLRGQIDPWYYQRTVEGEPRDRRRSDTVAARDAKLRLQREHVVPALNKLLARSGVLAGYAAQYALMAQQRLTPAELDQALGELAPPEDEAGDLLVLTADPAAAVPAPLGIVSPPDEDHGLVG